MPSKRQWKWTVLSLEFPIPAFIGRKSKQNIPQTSVSTLDYNLERQSETYNPQKVIKFESEDNDEKDVHIYLDTISKLNFNGKVDKVNYFL